MTNMNISLPEQMRAWVDAQLHEGRYGNLSEYVRDLIRRDQERLAQDRLERLLLEGLDSGPATPMTAADWADLRTMVTREAAKLKAERGEPAR